MGKGCKKTECKQKRSKSKPCVDCYIQLIGIARKSLILVVSIVGVLLDRLLNAETWIFRTLIAYFYITNEGTSLLENCVGLGLPIPQTLQDTLIQLKEGNKKELQQEPEMKIGLRGVHSRKAQGAVGMINAYEQMQKFYTHVSKLLKDMMG